MGYGLLGRLHATLASQRGQGTVEYVGLILLLAVVLAGVVTAAQGFTDDQGIAKTVVDKLKEAIDDVGGGK
jgi:Flp pilus assembly protein TadG